MEKHYVCFKGDGMEIRDVYSENCSPAKADKMKKLLKGNGTNPLLNAGFLTAINIQLQTFDNNQIDIYAPRKKFKNQYVKVGSLKSVSDNQSENICDGSYSNLPEETNQAIREGNYQSPKGDGMCLLFEFKKDEDDTIRDVHSFEAKKNGRTLEYSKLIFPIMGEDECIIKYEGNKFVQVVGEPPYQDISNMKLRQYSIKVER